MKRTPLLITTCLMAVALGSAGFGSDDAAGEVAFEINGDAAAGEKVFRKCKACHAVGEGAEHKAGPVLNGILGKAAGASDEFKYSKALVEKVNTEKLVWNPETLAEFLTKPKDFIKGTKMTFAGLRKEDDRANVIAYLAQFEGETIE